MKKKVLVFPCGSQAAIELNFALRYAVRIELYGASSVEDHGAYVYKNYIGGLPNIKSNDFIDNFNAVLKKYEIDFIIPTHDTVALFLVENESQLVSKVVSSSLETVKVCRFKSLTYQRFSSEIFVPNIYKTVESVDRYPVFLKPDDGQGGKGTHVASSETEVEFYLKRSPNLLICEYLPGEEISIDCFTSLKGELKFVNARTRDRTLGGISTESRIIPLTREIEYAAEVINAQLEFRGYWFFQMKKDYRGKYKLLEISSRFAGTSVLSYARDVNLPLATLLEFMGIEVEINSNKYNVTLDRSLINRYRLDIEYMRVYVDLDDTLIVNGKVNKIILMYLYQCINENKEIILITRHEKNLGETLYKYKISDKLFTEIVHINASDLKSSYIREDMPAIFIDNSFAERMEVRKKRNIPCFDVNNVECLIDWRD